MIRDFRSTDSSAVNALALSAFAQYKTAYRDWEGFSENLKKMSSLGSTGEIIVAEQGNTIVGAVAYIGPGKPKAAFFDPGWPIIRMLVVEPSFRGQGAGRKLTEACIERAKRDKASLLALHTSPIMEVALNMYLRMGFILEKEAPPIHGVPYGVYTKDLSSDDAS